MKTIILVSFIALLSREVESIPTLINGGCTDDDIPKGVSPFYDHSNVIVPYTNES